MNIISTTKILISIIPLLISLRYIYGENHCADTPKVLLISLDGFRYDYYDLAKAMNINISAFEKIQQSGFRILKLINEFPTSTFPSHFSMVTGLHPESHGIVDNVFYDPILNITFSYKNQSAASDSRFYDVGAEPIWVTNQKHGYKSAVAFWTGSEAKIKGLRPNYYLTPYNESITFKQRVDLMMNWFNNHQVNLGLLYYHQPDKAGHVYGAGSQQVFEAIEEINSGLQYLLNSIDSRPNLKCSLHVIISSDHGMTNISNDRIIYLNDYIQSEDYITAPRTFGVVWSLWPTSGTTAEYLYLQLKNKHVKMNVYLKHELPQRLHYANSERIGPVVVHADLGWMISTETNRNSSLKGRGSHGYDPRNEEMSSFLMAMGPRFNHSDITVFDTEFKLVDIYQMICLLLDLQPAPNNGSTHRIFPFLKQRYHRYRSASQMLKTPKLIGIIIVLLCISSSALF
ncbi:unnamed protein product [Heterobilharzia americana]|nr:unnamed protein product [Heterobilharzia americana]